MAGWYCGGGEVSRGEMSVRSAAAHLVNGSLVEDTLGITSGVLHSVADLVEVGGARRTGCEHRRAHVVDELGEEDLVSASARPPSMA
jgi:hypothetical protein